MRHSQEGRVGCRSPVHASYLLRRQIPHGERVSALVTGLHGSFEIHKTASVSQDRRQSLQVAVRLPVRCSTVAKSHACFLARLPISVLHSLQRFRASEQLPKLASRSVPATLPPEVP